METKERTQAAEERPSVVFSAESNPEKAAAFRAGYARCVRAENLGRAVMSIIRAAERGGAPEASVYADPSNVLTIKYAMRRSFTPEESAEAIQQAKTATETAAAEVELKLRPRMTVSGVEAEWTLHLPGWMHGPNLLSWAAGEMHRGLRYAPIRISGVEPGTAVDDPPKPEWGETLAEREEPGTGDKYYLRLAKSPVRGGPAGIVTHEGWVVDSDAPEAAGRSPETGEPVYVGVTVHAGPGSPLNEPGEPDVFKRPDLAEIENKARAFFAAEMNKLTAAGRRIINADRGVQERMASWGTDVPGCPTEIARWRPPSRRRGGPGPKRPVDAVRTVIVDDYALDPVELEVVGRALQRDAEDSNDPWTALAEDRGLEGYGEYDRIPRVTGVRMIEIHKRAGRGDEEYDLVEEWEQDLLTELLQERMAVPEADRRLAVDLKLERGGSAAETLRIPTDVLLPAPRRERDEARLERGAWAVVDRERFSGTPDDLRRMVAEAYRLEPGDIETDEEQSTAEDAEDERHRFAAFVDAAKALLPQEAAEEAIVGEAARWAAEHAPPNGREIRITVMRDSEGPKVLSAEYADKSGKA